MNWFDTSGLTSLAKTALKEAQKTIDKALDIQDEGQYIDAPAPTAINKKPSEGTSRSGEGSAFLSAWGLTSSGHEDGESTIVEQPIISESPSKSQSLWGSFTGSFFEQPDGTDKNVSIQVNKNNNTQSQDLRNESDESDKQSPVDVDSSGEHSQENTSHSTSPTASKSEEHNPPSKLDDKLSRAHLNRLSIISSESGKYSSDSVEVLGSQSLKTTPDSDIVSSNLSNSSSTGFKVNSESIEILPDSLTSPSSIECLGFDSTPSDTTETNRSFSSENSPANDLCPSGQFKTSRETENSGDSVSLLAEDDDDTISYNSVSECTAPTVLDTNGERSSPRGFPKLSSDGVKMWSSAKSIVPNRDVIMTEQLLLQPAINPTLPVSISESNASSNEGSWSDRTLLADMECSESLSDTNDRISVLETSAISIFDKVDDTGCAEDCTMDKLSDSSSFCNIPVGGDCEKENATCNLVVAPCVEESKSWSESASQSNSREQTSPISSESRSDLVKIGSDRTSGHTSGDEIETATSSDIEIIPSPNCEGAHSFCRQSPAKCLQMKSVKSNSDCAISPNLVDLVLGKSLATKVRGHNRELSEVSNQSYTSDDSHCSENDKLMRSLCEMAEILQAKEAKLVEVSKRNSDLNDENVDLKTQLENMQVKHEVGDINVVTEEYTQRLSALEKKFQQVIREKDLLRKQMELLKQESSLRVPASDVEAASKEKDMVIAELREEGEKLSKQLFTQSNIIKKLRAKEKENDQVIKTLRDKVADQNQQIDRLKRTVSSKEELETSQTEAVYKLTNSNKKLDLELNKTKSALDDALIKLETTKTSLDVAKKELTELQRNRTDINRKKEALTSLERDKAQLDVENEQLRRQLEDLRTKMVQEEQKWARREERLRAELSEARRAAADSRLGDDDEAHDAPLLAQYAALQQTCAARQRQHDAHVAKLTHAYSEVQTKLAKAMEVEKVLRDECQLLRMKLTSIEETLNITNNTLDQITSKSQIESEKLLRSEDMVVRLSAELAEVKNETQTRFKELSEKLAQAHQELLSEKNSCEAERRRTTLLQEQLREHANSQPVASRGQSSPLTLTMVGDVSPPHSITSESLGSSVWPHDDSDVTPPASSVNILSTSSALLEHLQSALQQREGELRQAMLAARQTHAEKMSLRTELARLTAELDTMQALQDQYDALLQMYGEKEEQLQEVKEDLQDVRDLYKMQFDEIIALKKQVNQSEGH